MVEFDLGSSMYAHCTRSGASPGPRTSPSRQIMETAFSMKLICRQLQRAAL